jgi:membrane-bound lytic murein transglycosylase
MHKLLWVALMIALSLSAWGQTTPDRNLVAIRKHSNVTTSAAPQMKTGQGGQQDVNSQLDKLERQTANTAVRPAAKSPKVQPYKLPPEPRQAADNSYQQTTPAHAAVKNGTGRASHSSKPAMVNTYRR